MRNRVTKGNGQGSAAFRRLTRADLVTFDQEAKDLILEAMSIGCVGRVSSKGHAILRNNAGGSTSVPRNLTSPNRSAQNARADMKRLIADHRPDPGPQQRVPCHPRRMTVAEAFVEHPTPFSRWFDALPGGLPADQQLDVSFDEAGEPSFAAVAAKEPAQAGAPTPRRGGHLKIAPEPGQEAEDAMTAEAHPTGPAPDQAPTDDSPDAVLARVREALGEDPRIAKLRRRVAELETELSAEKQRADEAQSRLGLIQEAFHA